MKDDDGCGVPTSSGGKSDNRRDGGDDGRRENDDDGASAEEREKEEEDPYGVAIAYESYDDCDLDGGGCGCRVGSLVAFVQQQAAEQQRRLPRRNNASPSPSSSSSSSLCPSCRARTVGYVCDAVAAAANDNASSSVDAVVFKYGKTTYELSIPPRPSSRPSSQRQQPSSGDGGGGDGDSSSPTTTDAGGGGGTAASSTSSTSSGILSRLFGWAAASFSSSSSSNCGSSGRTSTTPLTTPDPHTAQGRIASAMGFDFGTMKVRYRVLCTAYCTSIHCCIIPHT